MVGATVHAELCRAAVKVRVGGLTLVELAIAGLSPHREVAYVDGGAWRAVCADDLNWPALGTVGFRAGPVVDLDVVQLHAVA